VDVSTGSAGRSGGNIWAHTREPPDDDPTEECRPT